MLCKDPTKNDISAEFLGLSDNDDDKIVNAQHAGTATPELTMPKLV